MQDNMGSTRVGQEVEGGESMGTSLCCGIFRKGKAGHVLGSDSLNRFYRLWAVGSGF